MYVDLTDLSSSRVYTTMIQTLLPRPVAWVLTENEDGGFNLAPFSYFNAVCSDPPLVMLSIGKKPDGSEKDTRVNIKARKNFVIHIAHRALAQAVTASSATLPSGESELDTIGLKTTAFEGSPLPRLVDCRVAYACERYEVREIGPSKQALILGLVNRIFLDDAVVTTDGSGTTMVHADRVDPIGRLGGNEYVTFGTILKIPRPA